MSPLSRRELLQLAGSSVGLGVLATACGGRGPRSEGRAGRMAPNLRGRLRALIDELEIRYPIATALAITGRRVEVARDATESGVVVTPLRRCVFKLFDGTSWFVQITDDLSPDSLVATVDRLTERAGTGGGGTRLTRDAVPRDFFRRGGIELATGSSGWLTKLGELFEATATAGSSRVVYRGSFFTADDLDVLFLGEGQDLRQSITRSRGGSVFVARDGRETIAEEASRSGTIGLEAMRVPRSALEAAARRVLVVPAGPPERSADTDVVLSPAIVAEIVRVGLAAQLDAGTWQRGESVLADYHKDRIGDARFTLVDDPTLAGGYASYDFDDEGWLASPRTLVHRGVLRGPMTDRASAAAIGVGRTGHARLTAEALGRPHFSNLSVGAGTASVDDLVSDVKSGIAVEGPLLAECDSRRLRILVRARRGYEIKNGSLTGRVLGPIAVRGTLESLLLAIRGVSDESITHVVRSPDGLAGQIAAPTLLARAEVGA